MRLFAALAAVAALASGCAHDTGRYVSVDDYTEPSTEAEYVIKTGDMLFVRVFPVIAMAEVKSVLPRVLIADDYPDMVKAVSRLLMLDFDVVGTVADGAALLEAAARLQPDVIVLDVNLPGIDGLEACRRITQAQPAVKVVVFTAMNGRSVVEVAKVHA